MAPKRRRGRPIDGVLLLDKPSGISSNAALQRARRALGAERAGHTGTLDPMASGLLVLCFGNATKFSGELLDAGKSYRATLKFGERTDTGDAEGEIVQRRPVSVTMELLKSALGPFRGEISQVPPMYSALKRNGRPLYEYARAGVEIERLPRKVEIYGLEAVDLAGDTATLSVSCSKGTYVRTLAEDIGEALHCGAHLTGLVRTSVGSFRLEEACHLEELEARAAGPGCDPLLPVDVLLQNLPQVQLAVELESAFGHGQAVSPVPAPSGRVRVYASGRTFLGLGFSDGEGKLHPKRLLAAP